MTERFLAVVVITDITKWAVLAHVPTMYVHFCMSVELVHAC